MGGECFDSSFSKITPRKLVQVAGSRANTGQANVGEKEMVTGSHAKVREI